MSRLYWTVIKLTTDEAEELGLPSGRVYFRYTSRENPECTWSRHLKVLMEDGCVRELHYCIVTERWFTETVKTEQFGYLVARREYIT